MASSLLLDPRAMKRQMTNGNALAFLNQSHDPPQRYGSEPLQYLPAESSDLHSEFPSLFPRDDTYIATMNKGRKASSGRDPPHAPKTTFDPRALLDPKGAKQKMEKKEDVKANNHTTSANSQFHPVSASNGDVAPLTRKRDTDDEANFGQGSLIEKRFNVTDREARPVKRQRVEKEDEFPEEDTKPKRHANMGGGGELGEYVKKKREEGLKESGPLPTSTPVTVDLTTGDDDEVTVVGEANEKEVCYGRIESAKVQAHAVPSPSPGAYYLSRESWPTMKLSLARHPGKDNIIRVIDPLGNDFGNVDIKTSLALSRVMDSKTPKFRTQARLMARKKKPNEIPGREISQYYDLYINLYGPRKNAISIGRFFSQKQVWLRTPLMSDNGIDIFNPHAPQVNAPKSVAGPLTGSSSSSRPSEMGYVTRSAEEIRSEVTSMFDSLKRSEDMPAMEASPKIITPLLKHQKQALYFLNNKEQDRKFGDNEEDNNSLWRIHYRPNGMQTYYNVITGKEEREKPREVLGGILADMMGLGKTLNILALVVASLVAAEEFGCQDCPDNDGGKSLIRNSKSTLIVAPLSTVANWEQQIKAHLKPGTLKYYIYHGGNRISDIDELANYDAVITTYAIVASEHNRRGAYRRNSTSPLVSTNFFRIVLDEAHAIRESSTQQSQAICALSGQRRWAVTGTPVQNRLDDLGGLIKFLRMQPFNEKGGFAQYILSPFKCADEGILAKLRLLVDSITLRRLKDRIDLPPRHDKVIKLEFSEDERSLYDWFAKDSQNKLKIIASEQKDRLGGKSYAHILRAILRLRLLCAHGRELLSQDDLKIAEGFSADTAIDLEASDDELTTALSSKQAYEMLMLLKESSTDACIICNRRVEVKDEDNEKDECIGTMLQCYHVVCSDCMDGYKASIEQSVPGSKFKCPGCQSIVPKLFFDLTKSGIDDADRARMEARENPRQAKMMGRYGGPHTKVKALLQYLAEAAEETDAMAPGEPPIKSVVFSGWTTYLDLIQIGLEDNKIPFCRLDGKMPRKARSAALDAFRDDPAIRVMLVSIGAGGLGLNLTTGSRVFVMEPQFNPAAEAQAVDRVHRLGQTREVFTYRFVMNDSFEEKMLDLQRKKQNLADLSMNRGKLDKEEAAKAKLAELRSLFR